VNRRTLEGETPLLLACMFQDSTELVEMLLDCGADVDLGNNENQTPLHEGMIVVMVFDNNLLFWLLVSGDRLSCYYYEHDLCCRL
jgi:hypothetical protein